MNTGADNRLFTIDPTLAECVTPLGIDSPAECNTGCSIDTVSIVGTNVHNQLQGLQGGQAGQYYHLTAIEYQAVLDANGPTGDNPFATLADLSGAYSFSNGLTLGQSQVVLGGPLFENTTIDGSTNGTLTIQTEDDEGNSGFLFAGQAAGQLAAIDTSGNVAIISSSSLGGVAQAGMVILDSNETQVGIGFAANIPGIEVQDGLNDVGMWYGDDYHAQGIALKGDRWIPDAGWVNNAIAAAPTLTFNNGLTNTSGTVTLGGTSNQFTSIILGGNGFEIADSGANSLRVLLQGGEVSLEGGFPSTTSNAGVILLGALVSQIYWSKAVSGVAKLAGVFIDSTGFVAKDDIGLKGIVYGTDYSANFTARSLIDKGYADATYSLTFNNGLTNASRTVGLGGSLTGDTTITMASHKIFLSGGPLVLDNSFLNNRGIGAHFQVNNPSGVNRWSWQSINIETGSGNTGADLNLVNFEDDGTLVGSVMTFVRSSGLAIVSNRLLIGTGTDDMVTQLQVAGTGSFLTGIDIAPDNFTHLPASPTEGMVRAVNDSNTNTWGDTITGTGAFHVLAYYDGTNWTVMAK